jgi:hypothetical protein
VSGCVGSFCNGSGDSEGCTAHFCYSGRSAAVYFNGVKDGRFSHADWRTYWEGLTDGQRQSLRDKARWEHMTLSAVASQWGAIEPEPSGTGGREGTAK